MINHEFFENIDTEQKAYILGYIFTDGHVLDPKCKRYRIQLACIDEDIIIKIGRALGYEGELPQRVDHLERVDKGGHALFVFHFNSRGIWKKLNEFEATGRKTFRIKVPDIIPNLRRHFVRGCVDGDGSLHTCLVCDGEGYSRNRNSEIQTGVGFCSGSWDLISTVTKWTNNHTSHKAKIKIGQTKSGMAFYNVGWCGSNAYRVAKWLYKDANIFIDRKMSKYQEMKELYVH